MSKKNRIALSRGLDAILSDVAKGYENSISDHSDRIMEIDIELIRPNPFQPRKVFQESSIQELSESIIEHGLLQPIIVYRDEESYVLIAGERRLRASKLAGKESIRAIVAEIDLAKIRELALIENIQRENLNPIDLARSYQELIEEYSITHEVLAQKIKKSRTQVTNTLRLLQLTPEIQQALVEEKITQGHAKMLITLQPEEQKLVFDSIIGQKLSVNQTEKMVQSFKKGKDIKKITQNAPLSQLKRLQEIFRQMHLETKVLQQGIVISFQDEDQLRNLIVKLENK